MCKSDECNMSDGYTFASWTMYVHVGKCNTLDRYKFASWKMYVEKVPIIIITKINTLIFIINL